MVYTVLDFWVSSSDCLREYIRNIQFDTLGVNNTLWNIRFDTFNVKEILEASGTDE